MDQQQAAEAYHWHPYTGSIPHHAVKADEELIVIRGFHADQWIPGKMHRSSGSSFVAYGGQEFEVNAVEILVHEEGAEVFWIPSSHGVYPEGTIGPIGSDKPYIGRTRTPDGHLTPGKIAPPHKCFYYGHGGKELNCTEYEALIIRPNPVKFPAAHYWVRWEGRVPPHAVYASENLLVARGWHETQWVPGKLNIGQGKLYISYACLEFEVSNNIEVLVTIPGAKVHWIHASHGELPQGTVGPIGPDAAYIGRARCAGIDSELTPGKIGPTVKAFFYGHDGKELTTTEYEACVIKPAYYWLPFRGEKIDHMVRASDHYAVIRAPHHGELVPGKLKTSTMACYIPYGGEEITVTENVEVLVHAHGAQIYWVHAENGHIPENTVGPLPGTSGESLFVGRHKDPNNELTPGKIHPSHKVIYLPYGGEEQKHHSYEALVILPQ